MSKKTWTPSSKLEIFKVCEKQLKMLNYYLGSWKAENKSSNTFVFFFHVFCISSDVGVQVNGSTFLRLSLLYYTRNISYISREIRMLHMLDQVFRIRGITLLALPFLFFPCRFHEIFQSLICLGHLANFLTARPEMENKLLLYWALL